MPEVTSLEEFYWRLQGCAEESARVQLLDEIRTSHPQMAGELEKMLEAHESAGAFLEPGRSREAGLTDRLAATMDSQPAANGPPLKVPHTIGPYKLLERIGEGGMGLVYLAQQSQPVRRKVAIKIIKPGMDSRQVIARFEAERQALAMMDHPNIAKVLDAGTTDAGLPYFVMELVRGIPMTEYCDRSKMTIRRRLELLCEACDAVQHAHNKGIIHRDIKPSNVLVTENDGTPTVKVIDFGVAKALTDNLTDKTMFTGVFQMIGTPLYMSPEQAALSNIDVDTRSDIYSLGVMLYELITGLLPMERESIKSLNYEQLRRRIETSEPLRPSRRLSTLKEELETIAERRGLDVRQIRKDASSELDWVVMRAIEKDRQRRYQSPRELKEDIQRYLAGDAVEACPPTWSYQLSKYVRRHRSLLATAGVVAAMLVAATGVSLRYAWQAGEAAEAATLAKNEAISAQEQSKQHLRAALDAVDKLLKHASDEQLLKAPRLQPIVRNILDDSLAFYDGFEVTQGTTPEIRLRAANTRNQLAHLANQFSDLTESERIYLETLQELRELYKENPGEDSFVHGLCHAEIRWGWFCLQKKKDAVKAANFFASAKQRIEQLSSSDPKNVQFRNDNLIEAINGLSFAYQNQGKQEQREQVVLEAYQQHGIVTSSLLVLLRDRDPDLTAELWRRKLPEIRTEFAQSPSVGPVAKLISAAEFFRDYDRDQAIELYEDALESSAQLVIDYPQFNNSHEYFVRALKGATTTTRDQSQPILSARDLLLLASRMPPSAEAIHLSLAAEMQRCANPIALLTSAIEINPGCPAYSINRGAVLIELGRFEECLNDLNQDLEESLCAGPETYWYRSQIYLKLNELENSLEDLNRYVELDASHESLKQRGYFFMHYLRDNDRAIEDFSTAITLRPTGHSLYQHRARAHVRAGNLESAQADFQKSFELNKRETNGTWWIDVSWILKNGDEAFFEWMQDYLQRLVEANDRDTEFLQLHLQLALEREDFSQARADLAELKQSDQTTTRYRYWNYDALLAAHAGDLEQYREICADMLNEFGDVANVPALHSTAWSFALASDATDDYRDVIRLARRTLDNQIENPQFQTGLGAVYFRSGDYDAAKRHLMAALEAEKESASRNTSPAYAHYFLAMSHAALGEEEQATAELVKANQIASAELADSTIFVRRSTLEFLRKEAESLIGLIAK